MSIFIWEQHQTHFEQTINKRILNKGYYWVTHNIMQMLLSHNEKKTKLRHKIKTVSSFKKRHFNRWCWALFYHLQYNLLSSIIITTMQQATSICSKCNSFVPFTTLKHLAINKVDLRGTLVIKDHSVNHILPILTK